MVVPSPHPPVTVPGLSLHEFVLQDAATHAAKPALIDAPTGRTLSFAELAGGTRAVAGGLAAGGFGKGDVFAVYLPNVPEFAVAFLAVSMLGGVVTTINPLYTAHELAAQLRDAGASVLLTVPQLVDKATEAAAAASVREVYVLGEAPGATPFASLLAAGAQPPAVAIDPAKDLVVLPYSSGTTGLPKGVMLTHENLVANMSQLKAIEPPPDDAVSLGVLPFFHIYGMVIALLGYLHCGITLVTMPRFDFEEFLGAIQKFRVTRIHVVPPILLALAKDPRVDQYDLSSLDYLGTGAAPVSGDLVRACSQRLSCRIQQGYGLTEASPMTHLNPRGDDRTFQGSVGQCVPDTEAKIVDPETGAELGAGADGEVCVRGPQIMRGYLGRQDATDEILGSDGWMRTGDIGRLDEDGYLYLVDRAKELIKYKGYQVAPAELEGLLVGHDSVQDAAVVPMPDDEAGEVPKAFVVRSGDVTAEELMEFVAARVAPFKRLCAVEFIDAIPKSLSGKILRRELRDRP